MGEYSDYEVDDVIQSFIDKAERKHEIAKKGGLLCDVCRRTFKTVQGLNDHKRDAHGITTKVE